MYKFRPRWFKVALTSIVLPMYRSPNIWPIFDILFILQFNLILAGPCHSNPCVNGATCVQANLANIETDESDTASVGSDASETDSSESDSSESDNSEYEGSGGSEDDYLSTFTCQCPDGFTGQLCEVGEFFVKWIWGHVDSPWGRGQGGCAMVTGVGGSSALRRVRGHGSV